jgi:hypothetical protein
MDTRANPPVGEVQRLQDSAWQAIGAATVDGAERGKYWDAWKDHNRSLYGSEVLAGDMGPVTTDRLLTFAVAVREGKYGRGTPVKVQSVERALRHVAQKLVLDGHPDPRKASPAQQSLDLPISRLIKSYRDSDPPPEPKLAVPVSTIAAISENYRWSPHLATVADLVIIAFFYLLRVGKYTSPLAQSAKRTIPLRLCDIRLWRRGALLPHTASLSTLLTADSATICIAHTKNGTKGAVIHHEAFAGPICPVAALARRVANIQRGPRTGTLDTVYHASGRISKVSDRDIGVAVRWGATYDGLLLKGYTLNRISSHSLRAGGAMALKLSGALDSTIMRVGRWTSLTYLTYIHTQIGALTAELAWKMSTTFTFHNVG